MILKMRILESVLNQNTSTFSVILLFLTFRLTQLFEAAAWWVPADANGVRTCLAAAETGTRCPKGRLRGTEWRWRRKAKGKEGTGERTRHLSLAVLLPGM